MDTNTWVLFIGMFAGLAITAALPSACAWVIGSRAGLSGRSRRFFVLLCTLLAYGVPTVLAVLLSPLELLQAFVAPQLDHDGRHAVAKVIQTSADFGAPVLSLVAGVAATIFTPLLLRHRWPDVWSAIHANKSFKPNPLRGPA